MHGQIGGWFIYYCFINIIHVPLDTIISQNAYCMYCNVRSCISVHVHTLNIYNYVYMSCYVIPSHLTEKVHRCILLFGNQTWLAGRIFYP
jgi:hypothetical protein